MIGKLRDSGKIPAFLVHLGLSAAIVAIVGAAMAFGWYPLPYFQFDGGWQVMRIIVLVDVVLGPLLTLIVFRRGKPELRRDLAVIGIVQIAALLYGGGIMYTHRPAFVVYAERNFFTVTWPEVARATRDTGRLELFRAGHGPGFVNLRLPQDAAERARLRDEMRRGGPPVTHLGDLYEALSPADYDRIFAATIPIEQLTAQDRELADDVEAFIARHRLAPKQLAFVPITGRYGVVLAVFDRSTRRIVGWIT